MRAETGRIEYTGWNRRAGGMPARAMAACLAAAVTLGGLGVAGGRAVASEASRATAQAAVDEWDDLMIALFDLLLEIVKLNPPPKLRLNGTVMEWAAELNKSYSVNGIPENLTEAEVGAAMGVIEALAEGLANAPASFDPALRAETMATLREMYADLGGDPEELGG